MSNVPQCHSFVTDFAGGIAMHAVSKPCISQQELTVDLRCRASQPILYLYCYIRWKVRMSMVRSTFARWKALLVVDLVVDEEPDAEPVPQTSCSAAREAALARLRQWGEGIAVEPLGGSNGNSSCRISNCECLKRRFRRDSKPVDEVLEPSTGHCDSKTVDEVLEPVSYTHLTLPTKRIV